MRALLVLLAAFSLLAGCATVGDLNEIADAQQELRHELVAAVKSLQVDAETARKFDQRVAEAVSTFDGKVDVVKKAIETRVDTVASAGLTATESGGISALVVAAGLAALNAYRNRTRGRDPRVSNRLARSGSMRGALAPFILCGCVVALGCTMAQLRRLGSSARLEGVVNSGSGDLSRTGGRTWDTEEESYSLGVSVDLLPAIGVAEEEARSRARAADLVRALERADRDRSWPFEQSSPLPPAGNGSEQPNTLDGLLVSEAGASSETPVEYGPPPPPLPWWVTTEGIVGLSALGAALLPVVVAIVHPPTRRKFAAKATEIKNRRATKKAQKASTDDPSTE